eukprot:CAMPEP_0201945108 /NCGR_PEP_ID=MMETSP0903-20130614/53734_1 /ASSEMBLY_ACC=CAM_ASM_000552 /TAXON_ID=420261 /ORGANISM="Thalassiosira antarctica, Strain CCMP982" /LENGTH=869 /DNA_ID=CAMNT_0048488167 /DNA_START=93 /DNA_END=2702 /DNA_ORIENTATION=+
MTPDPASLVNKFYECRASIGAADASVKKAMREEMVRESGSESMPTALDGRLKQKLESGRKRRATTAGTANMKFEQRLRHKLESGGVRGGRARGKMVRVNRSESMPTTFEERLKRKLESESCRKRDGLTEIVGIANSARLEDADGSICSEEIQATVMEAQDQVQPMEREEGSNVEVPNMCIDEVIIELQRVREENGNIAMSHQSVSRFMTRLSTQMEPFVKNSSRWDYNAGPRMQGTLRSENRSQRFRQSLLGSLSFIFQGNADSGVLITASLVQDEGEVAVAQRVPFFARKWKLFLSAMCILLTLSTVLLSLTLTGIINTQGGEIFEPLDLQPSSSPTFDPRPTLEIVQERGHVRCGMSNATINSGEGFYLDLCRSVAAVVVGNPDSFEGIHVTSTNRWQHLLDRTVDLVVLGDTHTIEREVRESSTGAGFTFSIPYNYDGMAYFGNETFVRCAEELKRYDECSSLMICVERSTTHYDFLKTAFPSDYFKVGSSLKEVTEMLFNDTCNAIASEKTFILNVLLLNEVIRDGKFILGTKMMTKEPYGIITRNSDHEFSDIINWVIRALFFGEEQGLTKDPTLCQNYTDLTLHDVSDLDFMNSVYCVGNYREIYVVEPNNRGMNQINNGTGMLYAVPTGNIARDTTMGPDAGSSTLTKIRKEGSLNCGVIVPDNFAGNVRGSDKLVGMGVDYCRTLAAAIFIGDSEEVNFSTFTETDNSSFGALANGTIDVLVGGRVQRKYDFEMSPFLGGFHFSTPYYYGNEASREDVSFYSLATREDDVQFASFVNCMVLATIHAQGNDIHREKSREMPSCSVFGSDLNWALRDAIAYSGSYDEIYSRNFGSNVSAAYRGRNTLNKGGPLMLSFPHLPRQ